MTTFQSKIQRAIEIAKQRGITLTEQEAKRLIRISANYHKRLNG